jgi:predicted DsbA family dithiol-disulfide isomerase
VASAERMQIKGAPAFLFGTLSTDGQVLSVTKVMLGAEGYDAFKAILDELLGASSQAATTASSAQASASSTCG